MCERLQSTNSKTKYEMTCNRSHVWTIALHKFKNKIWDDLQLFAHTNDCSPQIKKQNMRWLAIIRTCKWLQSTNSKNKIWDDLQSFTRTNDCTPKIKKLKMRWLEIVRTYKRLQIAVHKFVFKKNMTCNHLHSTNFLKKTWLAIVRTCEQLQSTNFKNRIWDDLQLFAHTNDCMPQIQKQNMRWLAIIHTYQRLHSQKISRKTWLAIVRTYGPHPIRHISRHWIHELTPTLPKFNLVAIWPDAPIPARS